jgi:hypothetical protein
VNGLSSRFCGLNKADLLVVGEGDFNIALDGVNVY